MASRLIGLAQVAQLLRLSEADAWQVMRTQTFPRPAAEDAGRPLWDRKDIERWMAPPIGSHRTSGA